MRVIKSLPDPGYWGDFVNSIEDVKNGDYSFLFRSWIEDSSNNRIIEVFDDMSEKINKALADQLSEKKHSANVIIDIRDTTRIDFFYDEFSTNDYNIGNIANNDSMLYDLHNFCSDNPKIPGASYIEDLYAKYLDDSKDMTLFRMLCENILNYYVDQLEEKGFYITGNKVVEDDCYVSLMGPVLTVLIKVCPKVLLWK